ncbi:putative reverse transcriptase domain-containing protein [Tanacetum coccineum]
MTRSSTKELFTPFKEPKREFRSSRKHFKTLNLDESRSPDFDLFSDQEEYSEEEVAKMAETIEQYMSKTQADYGSGVSRHKIVDKDNFELKGQFLKELRTNTFSGSDHEDPNEHIEKFHEIVDLFHIPNITIDQVMLRSFPMSLIGAASHWLRNKPSSSITTWEYLKTKFLSKYCPPARTAKKMEEINNFQQEPDESLYQAWERFKELLMKCAIPSKTVADAKVAIQEIAKYSQKWHNKTSRTKSIETSDGLAAIQAQLNNLGREIKKVNEKVYAAQVGCEQCKGPHYTKDCPLKEEGKTLEEAYYTQFEAYSYGASHINNSIPKKEKDPGSFTLPCFINNVCFDNALANLGASISVMPLSTYLNLGLGELAHTKLTVKLADWTVKYPKGLAENMIVGIGKFIFLVDFIILDMAEDIKVPLILGRPFLSTAHVKIDVFKKKITLRVGEEKIIFKSVKHASSLIKRVYMLSLRERMKLNLEARLMGETLVLNRSLDPFLEDYIELNDLNVPLELRRDQADDLMPIIEEGKVIEEFRARNDARIVSKVFGYPSDYDHDKKIHIDCAYNLKFSCMIDFAILEDMDSYRDERMSDVIFGEPFLREVRINAKRFEGMITIDNGNEEVTYQMFTANAGEDPSYVLSGPEDDWNFLSAFMCYVELQLDWPIDRQLPFEYTIASKSTYVIGMALPDQNINHSAFRSMFKREKLSGSNFNDWFCSLKLNAVYDAHNKVACLMLGSITPDLHRQFENYSPYEMLQELKSMFEKQAGVESVGLILKGLTSDFAGSIRNYNMHNMGKTIGELHALLIEYEKGLPKKAATPQVMAIQSGVGHWKRNCPVYLAELKKKKKKVGTASSSVVMVKNEVENLLGKTIKALRSDRGGEYISQEFKDYLEACGIVQQLIPPYTPQPNESTTRILNMVPTKKVYKTPYELWYGKVPNLTYLKAWGCEVLVKRDTPDKLQKITGKCIFVGYPNETMGYYFYFPLENKIVVVRYVEFFKKNLISQEVSERA